MSSLMVATEGQSPLLTLPNELFSEVASHLKSFQDLNSLLRTSRFFHTLFNPQIYRRAVAANDASRENIVQWVLSEYRLASLTLLLDNGLSVDQKLPASYVNEDDTEEEDDTEDADRLDQKFDLLRRICELEDQARSVPLARLLISRGADIVAKHVSDEWDTVLHYAAYCKNCGMAELLLANGADVNALDKSGNTPLHFACYSFRDAEMANVLLAHGADIEARDEDGDTPLLRALRRLCTPVIATLRVHGADPFVRGYRGMTPLHWASHWGLEECVGWLLSQGADVNGTDVGGQTPLHWASAARNDVGLSTATLLLEHGADPSAADLTHEITPLLCAIMSCSDEVVRFLIARGADVSVLEIEDRRRVEELCS